MQSDHFRGLLLTSSTSSHPLSTVLVVGEKESSQRAWSYGSTAPAMGVMSSCHCSHSPFFSNSTQWYSNLYWPWLRMDTWPRARSFIVTLWRGAPTQEIELLVVCSVKQSTQTYMYTPVQSQWPSLPPAPRAGSPLVPQDWCTCSWVGCWWHIPLPWHWAPEERPFGSLCTMNGANKFHI